MIWSRLNCLRSYLTRTVLVSAAGLEIVDSEHAHELALDCLAELGLAVDDRVLEPQATGQLVLDLPVRDDRARPEVTDLAVGVTDRSDRRDRHAERLERGGGGSSRLDAVLARVSVGMSMTVGTEWPIATPTAIGVMIAVGREPCGDSASP